MKSYLVTYHVRAELEGMTDSEKATVFPRKVRVGASNARRAESSALKVIQAEGIAQGFKDLIIVEVKVVG